MFFFATLGIIGCCHSGCYFCNSSHSGDKINTLVIIAGMTVLAVGRAIVILDVAVIAVIIIIVLSLVITIIMVLVVVIVIVATDVAMTVIVVVLNVIAKVVVAVVIVMVLLFWP